MTQCKAITQSGEQCKRIANDSGYCYTHDPNTIKIKEHELVENNKKEEQRKQLLNQPRFSLRKGLIDISKTIQINDIDETLRNSLWNILYQNIFYRYDESKNDQFYNWERKDEFLDNFTESLWRDFFYSPLNLKPSSKATQLSAIFKKYNAYKWNEIYDFIEYVLNYVNSDNLNNAINDELSRKLSGYRFVGGVITDITSKQEIELLEETLNDDTFPAVKSHLRRALELLSDKQNPDYRNSIKESISAVESLAQAITGDPKATLGKALDKLEMCGKKIKIHPALRSAYSSLYGYTSDEGGIRHAMTSELNLSPEDAKFFLLICSAFINYVKSKL
jgi:hypothetical protein